MSFEELIIIVVSQVVFLGLFLSVLVWGMRGYKKGEQNGYNPFMYAVGHMVIGYVIGVLVVGIFVGIVEYVLGYDIKEGICLFFVGNLDLCRSIYGGG